MNKTKEMTFWEHVYELRRRTLIVISFVFILSIVGYFIYPYLFNIIYNVIKENLYARNISEGFLTRIKTSILIGFFFSIPVLIFQIILFVFPALKKNEKIFFLLTVFSSFALFVLGLFFSYKTVLPISIKFLTSKPFFPENVNRLLSYNEFIKFFFTFLIGFGISFQFPVIIIFLLKIGLLKMNFLTKNYKYFIIACFVLSAILTPPDVASQIMLALPMILLYTLSIIIGKMLGLGK